jgi:Mn-dependent DtxR family transcriptional regulator
MSAKDIAKVLHVPSPKISRVVGWLREGGYLLPAGMRAYACASLSYRDDLEIDIHRAVVESPGIERRELAALLNITESGSFRRTLKDMDDLAIVASATRIWLSPEGRAIAEGGECAT